MATVTKTIGTAGGRDYSTVTAWEADLGNVGIYSSGDDAIGECYNDSVFTARVTFAQSTVPFNTVTLRPASGERHDGTIGTGVEFDWDNIAGQVLGDLNTTGYATIEGIVFDGEYSSSTLDMSYLMRIAAGDWKVLGCIINKKRWLKSSISPIGIHDNGGNNTVIANNIVQNCGRYTGGAYVEGYAIHNNNSSAHNAEYYNNTMFAGYRGFRAHTSINNYVKNNIAADMASSDYTWGNAVHDYNISNDSTATGTNSITGVSTSSLFVSTVYGSEDLHILSTSSAVGAGVDLGSTPDGIQYDIDNYDRTAASNWSIGADQYVSPVTTLTSSASLFIPVSPILSAELFVRGANVSNDLEQNSIPLFLAKQPEGFVPLVIGTDNTVSGQLTLYNDGSQGGGGTDITSNITLYVEGMANSGIAITSNPTLYINGPEFAELESNTPLVINGDMSVASGTLTFFTSGDGAEPSASSISLFIRNQDSFNSNVPLHIQTDFNMGSTTTLFLSSRSGSGLIPLHIDGKLVEEDSITLFIKPPTSSSMSLFNRGYRE